MGKVCLFTLYNHRSKKPRCVGMRINGQTIFRHLYRPGEGKPVGDIKKAVKSVRDTIIKANRKNQIVLSDFKKYAKDFDLPCDTRQYNVYDLGLDLIESDRERVDDEKVLVQVLDRLENQEILEYHKILANAAIVYQDLEYRGVMQNYGMHYPQWSLQTYTGRSKSLGFNVQGWHQNDHIRPPGSNDSDVLIHFDWICADIRVASLLSNDRLLQKSFERSDPYTLMTKIINNGSSTDVTRDECKILLLKSINSMDFQSVALHDIYKGLGRWVAECKSRLHSGRGCLESILGRKFRLATAKNELAAFNGVMQGSVAHAMQLTLRRSWELYPHNIVTEIHDSMVLSCPKHTPTIKSMINSILPIMLHPFKDVLESNPMFPLKVSIGPRWKEWQHYKTYRGLDGEAKEIKVPQDQAEEQREEAQTG